MKLSKNLSLEECISSSTASKYKIDNTPSPKVVNRLKLIAEHIFQPVRDALGVPIKVSSGYRSPELNRKIGGAMGSQHTKGEALDLKVLKNAENVTNAELFRYIIEHLDYDQVIWEFGNNKNPKWVHISYKNPTDNRKQALRAVKINGKVKYLNYEA